MTEVEKKWETKDVLCGNNPGKECMLPLERGEKGNLGVEVILDKSDYHTTAREIANLVVEKQKAYGDSFGKAEDFMKIIYPGGIPVEKYSDMLTLVRIWDKIMRIATDKDALGESPYGDIMGYCLLALNNKEINNE